MANSNKTHGEFLYGEPTAPTNLAASSKRLDELDAEIKQLRKAIEELNKTLKDKK